PLELPPGREQPVLRALDAALGRPRAGPELQHHGEPARGVEPLSLRLATRRLRSTWQCDAYARRRCRIIECQRRQTHAVFSRLRERAFPDSGRTAAASRWHGKT